MKCVTKNQILISYKQAFSFSLKYYKSKESHNIIKNGFFFIIYNLLENNISLHDLPYFVETITFCLSEKETYMLGDELLNKIYLNNKESDLKIIFENELINSLKYY